jgi:N-acetylneuraminic acid mutarotase
MITTIRNLKLLRIAVPCTACVLLTACGGGGGGEASITTYNVSATAGTGGSISPPSTSVNAGSTTMLMVTPNSGYAVSSVTGCGGTLTGTTYTTGPISGNCTVTASFVAQYAVTATGGNGGAISPSSATVNAGSTTTLTVTPNSGYGISSVTGCGGTLSGNTYTTGPISGNCTVTASFVVQYAVTTTAGTGGAISPSSATVNAGSTTTFTVTPKSGYVISGVTGCGGSLSGNTYDTGALSGSCTVTATFSAAFTWVNGPRNGLLNGLYGTKGVPSANTVPGARNGSAAWTDASRNLWLFGGYGIDYGSTGSPAVLNDLWKYSPSSGEWTWVGGSNTANAAGVYGAKGTPASTNMPGARQNAVTWTDTSGNVWLFGGTGVDSTGIGSGVLNDLWVYSSSNGEWTWVGGSSTGIAVGVYGTKGTPASTNVPGARLGAVSWEDANGNLWLFGGWGSDSAGMLGYLNDVWEYSRSSGEWTWISGSNTVNARGNYGSQGTAASANVPGARSDSVSWTDADGNLWLFGGMGSDSTGTVGNLNDLWMFSQVSGGWIWFGGSNTAQAVGVYGTQGVGAAANVPGARRDAVGWTDAAGNLWLFGGWGSDSNGTVGYLNDLWEYSFSSSEWVWIKGSSTANALSVHGTQGITAATNMPGGREQVTSAKDASGNVWLFGGFGYGFTNSAAELNNLWVYPTQ